MQINSFKLPVFTFLLIVICSCTNAQKNFQLSPKEFSKAVAADEVQLVDVRTPDEFEREHLSEALNIDWKGDDFDEETSTLDKNKPVYVYCASGNRSSQAAEHMRKAGFKQVYELKGGMTAWEQELLLKAPANPVGKEEE